MTQRRAIAVAVSATLLWSGCGGSNTPQPPASTTAANTKAPARCATDALETGPNSVGNGGPTLGPVTIAIGVNGTTEPLRGQDRVEGRIRTKMLVIVDAPAGRSFRLAVSGTSTGADARFTHQQHGIGWADGVRELAAPVPKRGSEFPNRPADIPGYLLATKAGCYALDVTYNGRRLGTIGLRLLAPPT